MTFLNANLLIVAGFGTTSREGCSRALDVLERHLATAFPDWTVRRVFTSERIRAVWRDRGIHIDDLETALEQAADAGFRRVLVLPTHLIMARESGALAARAMAYAHRFPMLRVATPLLATPDGIAGTAEVLAEAVPEEPGLCRVFMGHGARGTAASAYSSLETAFGAIGRGDIIIDCMEGDGREEDPVAAIKTRGYHAVEIRPLMLVAGDTFAKGLESGGGRRLIERLAAAGIPYRIAPVGLGEYPEMREFHVKRVRDMLA